MIRGAIEQVTATTISGWIYSKAVPLRDRLIQAFSGEECVGTGTIGIFRKDLHQAGLGDGYAGFHFPLVLTGQTPLDSIVVKLQDSDLVLLQQGCIITRNKPLGAIKQGLR